MAIKDGYIRWSGEAVGAIRWDTEEKEGMAVVIDEANGETYEIGGGGGESDISTAQITIEGQHLSVTGTIPICETFDDPAAPVPGSVQILTELFPGTYTIPLYKTGCLVILVAPESYTLNVSGNAVEADPENHIFLVTGDAEFEII